MTPSHPQARVSSGPEGATSPLHIPSAPLAPQSSFSKSQNVCGRQGGSPGPHAPGGAPPAPEVPPVPASSEVLPPPAGSDVARPEQAHATDTNNSRNKTDGGFDGVTGQVDSTRLVRAPTKEL